MEEVVKIIVKWSGHEYEINHLTLNDTVEKLKDAIFTETGVRPQRQKLLNLKYKGWSGGVIRTQPLEKEGICLNQCSAKKIFPPLSLEDTSVTMIMTLIKYFSNKSLAVCKEIKAAKPADDSCKLLALNLKPGFKIMMMGSLEDDIVQATTVPEEMPDVINDLDIPDTEIAIENMEVHLSKIEKRIKEYEIFEISSPRAGKNLLVLDIDYTLFDHRSAAETGAELMRPYLHEFLTTAYEDYDIVIWSATSMKWIEEKMKLLGVSNHTDYKILFYLDHLAMISVHTPKYGVVNVKPLGVIWGKYPQYSSKNTIMFDDMRRNFLMNPNNGLRIRAFRQAHINRQTDTELLKLSQYLKDISTCEDFAELDHRHWEKYSKKKREGKI